MGYWYNNEYGKDNIAISTRVRLARNIVGFPFPSKMNDAQREELSKKVKNSINGLGEYKLKFIDMSDVPENERYALFERHIISKEFAENPKDRYLIISDDETISIMIGEEDHIRIQVIGSGFTPKETYKKANEIDNELIKNLPIAFDKELGFLTECPTNLGTGLRVSVMLHLPLLEANKKISSLVESLNKIGFTIRGMYGEGTKAISSFYQISNQITLGITEEGAIENLINITNQIIELEENLRKDLQKIYIEDKSSRALHILKGAKILETSEMFKLLSDCLIGQNLELIDQNAIAPIKTLIECGPYMLMSKYGDKTPMERDILRANIVNKSIKL